jgi:sterol desaturase/sphingolipid hydroxylase (fatty acid hydroxylase superfamily)
MNKLVETFIHMSFVSVFRYFLLAGLPFLLFYLFFPNYFRRFKIQDRYATQKDFLREIWYSMQSSLMFIVIALLIWFTPIKNYTLIYDHLHDYPVCYLFASVFLSLVIHDTYFYWLHRGLHTTFFYKQTHQVHHQSINPSPWTAYSFHVLEAVGEGMILLVIVLIIPIHQLGILLFTIAAFAINVYGHLGYETAPKWFRHSWLFEVLNTSVHHNLHHSKFVGNYGLYFRFWDRLMKTENPDYVKQYDAVMAKRRAGAAARLQAEAV